MHPRGTLTALPVIHALAGDYYRDPNGLPDLKALQSNTDTAYQLGFLKTQLTIAPYAELGPVKEAATRLGLR